MQEFDQTWAFVVQQWITRRHLDRVRGSLTLFCFSRSATAGRLMLRLFLCAFFAQMGAVLLKDLECISISVIGHVVHAAHLFNGEGIDRAALGLKSHNGLAETIYRCLFLCCCVGTQVRILVTGGKRHSLSPSSFWNGGNVSTKGR